jgi:pimeloyl-ACP methyl ester carboxylesterase
VCSSDLIAWSGPVAALDFSGHGASGRILGGGYTPELLAGDADAALAQLGTACVAGLGLGAWVALLLAGARLDQVPAALLLPGPGLAGAGALPDFEAPLSAEWIRRTDARLSSATAPTSSDPLLVALERDVRPVDYAEAFALRARRVLLAEVGATGPPWWEAIAALATVERVPGGDLHGAFARLSAFA